MGAPILAAAKFGGRLALCATSWAIPIACVRGAVCAVDELVVKRVFFKIAQPDPLGSSLSIKKITVIQRPLEVAAAALALGGCASLLALGIRLQSGRLSASALREIAMRTATLFCDVLVICAANVGHDLSNHKEFAYNNTSNKFFRRPGCHSKTSPHRGQGWFYGAFLYFGLRALRGIAEVAKPGCTLALVQRIWPVRV